MNIQGKLTILALVGLGIAAAVGGMVYNHFLHRNTLALMGGRAARLVRKAPDVEWLQLEPLDEARQHGGGESIDVGGRLLAVRKTTDLRGARGLINVRHALTIDASYAWDAPPPADLDWAFALRFSDAGEVAVLLLDRSLKHLRPVRVEHAAGGERPADRSVALRAKIADGLAGFIAEQFPEKDRTKRD